MTDPRIPILLRLAKERGHPFYAAQAFGYARQAGDTAAMQEALELGAAKWRPEPPVYARTADVCVAGKIAQMAMFEVEEAV
jgi:hypothetical protein